MPPRLAPNHTGDILGRDSVTTGQFGDSHPAGGIQHTDFSYLWFGQFMLAITLPARGTIGMDVKDLPPLVSHITHIIKASALKKMRWVYAGRIVTVMTDRKTVVDGADAKLIGNTVRLFQFARNIHLAISGAALAGRPQPAPIRPSGLVNLFPKAFFQRSFHATPIKGDTHDPGRFLSREPAQKIMGVIKKESRTTLSVP